MAGNRSRLDVSDPGTETYRQQRQRKTSLPRVSSLCLAMSVLATALLTFAVTFGLMERCSTGILGAEDDPGLMFREQLRAARRREDVRLPGTIRPEDYGVRIVTRFWDGNFTFKGEVDILLNVTQETREVILHSADLAIQERSTWIRAESESKSQDTTLKIIKQYANILKQFWIIELAQPLKTGWQYKVHLEYEGKLNDDLRGFYRTSYRMNNETRWAAATQFQPTDARRAFPCFDEPALKAKFQISLARPKNMTSISNMPKSLERPAELPDYVWDIYEKSVPMSTYLVAFAISDFEVKRSETGNFNVWARKEAIDQAAYALATGPKILKYYEDYFQIKFPLPKIDMIALPDFSAGAMENWGLITYREAMMLFQEGTSTVQNKQRSATVISHELAHQWFGNLVTMKWWSDLWLNEGFASYIENLGVDAVEPDWNMLDQFVVYEMHQVLDMDALESSHPVSIPVGHPEEINEIFDRISYNKGASLIRMMDHYLTTEVFKRGLTNYLNERSYKNAEQDDLWDALTRQAHDDKVLERNLTIKQIMDTWTLQTGFPIVTVTRDYSKNSAKLTQERFVSRNFTQALKPHWWIPINYATSDKTDFTNTKPMFWMKPKETAEIANLGAAADQWVIVNVLATGYYRVNYDAQNWELIIRQLRSEDYQKISTLNRAQLVNDALSLAKSGYLDYATALNVTAYLIQETEFIPWKAAFAGFEFLDKMLIMESGYDMFRVYMLKLLQNVYKQIGFVDQPSDGHATALMRMEILKWSCEIGHEDCVGSSVRLYRAWMNSSEPTNSNPVPPNYKSVVYCTALRYGGLAEWDFGWQQYVNSNVGSEKDLLLQSLGCSREVWVLSRYLDRALDEGSGIRKQDAFKAIKSVTRSLIGQSMAFEYFLKKWPQIRDNFRNSQSILNHVIAYFTRRINTRRQLRELQDFMAKHAKELTGAVRTFAEVIEKAQINIEWSQRKHASVIHSWLRTSGVQ